LRSAVSALSLKKVVEAGCTINGIKQLYFSNELLFCRFVSHFVLVI
jgi:hypothetical protein